ncbi:terpenoid synthase [Dendrothele bispora CBS 962.96]|uniref:Terpenoid synthase n=1 Tax=Dendrothele bispora (strain CBS 962.96) TaxID=1314807 RepID=A0A4S8LD66_DENBC|nr:terpenoid synthase [Dendrothele bispora CBS 962.96]
MIFIDDLSRRIPSAITEFQHRILLNKPQLDPALAQFPRILSQLYWHWDHICANSMVCAALEFISGTAMEDKDEIQRMVPHPAALNWPRFLRMKTGIAPAYSYAVFPKSHHPDTSVFVQALPDMDDFINLGNDILSFYKEALDGDQMTYVAFRAKITNKHPICVVSEMVDEITQSHERIVAILSGHPEALKWWLTFEKGYIGWHLDLQRYKLAEIGFHM